jgi:hypothetical protein
MRGLGIAALAYLCLTLATAPGRADQGADGRGHPFIDPFIENLAGRWEVVRSIRGQQVRNTLEADWVLEHQFLRLHMKDVAVPPQYEAIVLLGYSHADSQYVLHWCDTFGGRYSGDGFGRRTGDSIPFTFEYPDGPFFNTFRWHPASKTWTFEMENGDQDGSRSPFAVDSLRRMP